MRASQARLQLSLRWLLSIGALGFGVCISVSREDESILLQDVSPLPVGTRLRATRALQAATAR